MKTQRSGHTDAANILFIKNNQLITLIKQYRAINYLGKTYCFVMKADLLLIFKVDVRNLSAVETQLRWKRVKCL